jgi:hypothetical protein
VGERLLEIGIPSAAKPERLLQRAWSPGMHARSARGGSELDQRLNGRAIAHSSLVGVHRGAPFSPTGGRSPMRVAASARTGSRACAQPRRRCQAPRGAKPRVALRLDGLPRLLRWLRRAVRTPRELVGAKPPCPRRPGPANATQPIFRTTSRGCCQPDDPRAPVLSPGTAGAAKCKGGPRTEVIRTRPAHAPLCASFEVWLVPGGLG